MDNDEQDRTIRDDKTGEQPGADLAVAPASKTIVVNGRSHDVIADELGRDELARLAFPGKPEGGGALTIAYDHGPAEAPSGLVPANRATRVLHGQTFSVSLTDKS